MEVKSFLASDQLPHFETFLFCSHVFLTLIELISSKFDVHMTVDP